MNYQVFDAKVLSKSLGRMLPMNYQVLTLFKALGDFGAFFFNFKQDCYNKMPCPVLITLAM